MKYKENLEFIELLETCSYKVAGNEDIQLQDFKEVFTIFLRLIAILLVLRLLEALASLNVFSRLYVLTTTLSSMLMIS